MNSSLNAQEKHLITQTIKYLQPDAEEVYLVWGVNNWQQVADELQPSKTVIKNKVMYTLMNCKDDTFLVNIKVTPGDKLDFGFLITKEKYSTEVNFWEADDERDFRIVAEQDNVIEIKSKLKLDHWMSFYFLIGISTVFSIYILSPVFRRWMKSIQKEIPEKSNVTRSES